MFSTNTWIGGIYSGWRLLFDPDLVDTRDRPPETQERVHLAEPVALQASGEPDRRDHRDRDGGMTEVPILTGEARMNGEIVVQAVVQGLVVDHGRPSSRESFMPWPDWAPGGIGTRK